MSLRKFYTVYLYKKSPPILKRCFILNYSEELNKSYCDCNFNVIKGKVKLEKKDKQKCQHFHEKGAL